CNFIFKQISEEFKDNVTKVLELTDIENWDGAKIKDKENEIIGFGDNFSIYENIILNFSLDSKTLAVRTNKNSVQILKLDNKPIQVTNISTKEGDTVENINFSADGKIVITTNHHTVKLWQLKNKANKGPKLLRIFPGHKNQVTDVSISPNGQIIASASHDNTVKLWQRNRELPLNFKKHKNKVNSVSFSPDGKLVASASDDRTIKIWEADSGKKIRNCKGHIKGVESASFSPDGKIIASIGKDNTVRLWNIEGEGCKFLHSLGSGDSIYGVSFHPESPLIAISSQNANTLWNINNGTRLASFEGLQSTY
ncbi:MAG: WD40 repeat domain-containing protein, partial [Cyanobacteria bacterium J06629_18]